MKNKLAIGLGVLGGAAVTYALLNAGVTGLQPPRSFDAEFSLDEPDGREPLARRSPTATEDVPPAAANVVPQQARGNGPGARGRGAGGRGAGGRGPAAELRSLVQRDPQAALEEALRIAETDQRPGPLFGVLADWGAIDREAALKAALELAAARGEPRGLAYIQNALRSADVAEAQALFRDAERFPPEQVTQLRHVALRMMSTQDPALAARELENVQSREARAQLARIMADDYAGHDAYAGLEWARGLEPPVAGLEATMLAAIARSDPYRALDLAAQSKDPAGIRRTMQRIVDAALDSSAADVARLADAALRATGAAGDSRVIQGVMSAWAEREPRAALDWLLARAGPVPTELFTSTAAAVGRRNADLAVAYANRVPPDLRDDWLASTAQSYARANPQAAAAWVGTLRGDAEYARAASTVAMHLAAVDAPAAARLLETAGFEPGGVRGALRTVANEWARKDPAAAAQWSTRLPEAARDEALSGVVDRWLQDDFATARSWVTRSARGASRDRLLAMTMNAAAAQGTVDGALLSEFDSEIARSLALRGAIAVVAQRDEWAARDALNRYVTDTALRAELDQMLDSVRASGPR